MPRLPAKVHWTRDVAVRNIINVPIVPYMGRDEPLSIQLFRPGF